MTTAMQPSFSESEDSGPARGMSDEEELRRFSGAVAENGIGETVFDMTDDLRELGLLEDH